MQPRRSLRQNHSRYCILSNVHIPHIPCGTLIPTLALLGYHHDANHKETTMNSTALSARHLKKAVTALRSLFLHKPQHSNAHKITTLEQSKENIARCCRATLGQTFGWNLVCSSIGFRGYKKKKAQNHNLNVFKRNRWYSLAHKHSQHTVQTAVRHTWRAIVVKSSLHRQHAMQTTPSRLS